MVNEVVKYDKAMFDFLRVQDSDGNLVNMVFAPPQRAFATVAEIYNLPDPSRIPLPVMGLHRGDIMFDPMRYVHHNRVIARYDDPPNHDKVKITQWPQPILIMYNLDFWTYTTEELLWIQRSLSVKFTHELAYITVDLEEYGFKRFAVKLDSANDTSELEAGELERKLRYTFSFTMNGMLHKPLVTKETVKSIDMEYRELEGDVLLRVQEVVKP